jgi:hypothetical protein
MALSKSEEEFEAQIRAMKHLPPPPPQATLPPPTAKRTTGHKLPPTTLRQETGLKMALPPVAIADKRHGATGRRLHHQFEAEYDREADTEFYKDFKFTFVCLPIPSDALPREY